MESRVSEPVEHLEERLHIILQTTRLSLGTAALLLVLWTIAGGTAGWIGAVLATMYLVHKGLHYARVRRVERQLRMEALFVRHCPNAPQLRECLSRRQHLWRQSLSLTGLENVLSRPLPTLLLASEKRERIQHIYRGALGPLQLPRFNADGLVLVAALAYWFIAHVTPADLLIVVGATLLTSALVFMDARLALFQSHLRRSHRHLAAALADWTLEGSFNELLAPPRAYTHTLLYRARPWFARNDDTAHDTSPLRRVA